MMEFKDLKKDRNLQKLQRICFAIGWRLPTKCNRLDIFSKLGNKIQDIRIKRN